MRAAIYFLPDASSSLWGKARRIIGYDPVSGDVVPVARLGPLSPAAAAAAAAEPSRYGFHATLKAPFRLAAGHSLAELVREAERIAAVLSPVRAFRMQTDLLDGFVALTPCESIGDLNDLAAACVTKFDRFRAPMTVQERERRLSHPLGARQIALMDRWGYPFVLEEFRFHMTLTGRLAPDIGPSVREAIDAMLQPEDLVATIDALSICTQDSPESRFREFARIRLGLG